MNGVDGKFVAETSLSFFCHVRRIRAFAYLLGSVICLITFTARENVCNKIIIKRKKSRFSDFEKRQNIRRLLNQFVVSE